MGSSSPRRAGFTIIELLVVIVVIGILAAITIVAFSGVQQKAHVAALQSDLNGAVSTLEIANTDSNGSYPADLSSAGLKNSPGTSYRYTYTSDSNSYCLTGTNSGVNYMVSSDKPTPTIGVCPGQALNGGVTTTLAGKTSSPFYYLVDIAVNASGTAYVVDTNQQQIFKITPDGTVSLLAGQGMAGSNNGFGVAAQFDYPGGIAVDASGNIYVADTYNYLIRKITPDGTVSTLAGNGTSGHNDGPVASATFWGPNGLAVDSAGNIYVADTSNNRIRKIVPGSGIVSTVTGGSIGFLDGSVGVAEFNAPNDVAVDSAGNIYVADTSNNRIRKITPGGTVSTLAGSGVRGFADGLGGNAKFNAPDGIAVDAMGNIYVADTGNNRIRMVTPDGTVSTLAGSGAVGSTDGTGVNAQFSGPKGIDVDSSGTVYVVDPSRVRKLQ